MPKITPLITGRAGIAVISPLLLHLLKIELWRALFGLHCRELGRRQIGLKKYWFAVEICLHGGK